MRMLNHPALAFSNPTTKPSAPAPCSAPFQFGSFIATSSHENTEKKHKGDQAEAEEEVGYEADEGKEDNEADEEEAEAEAEVHTSGIAYAPVTIRKQAAEGTKN